MTRPCLGPALARAAPRTGPRVACAAGPRVFGGMDRGYTCGTATKEWDMANGTGGSIGGIGLGGVLVIAGVVVAIAWSLWLGIILALVGLIAFGGFAKGRWY